MRARLSSNIVTTPDAPTILSIPFDRKINHKAKKFWREVGVSCIMHACLDRTRTKLQHKLGYEVLVDRLLESPDGAILRRDRVLGVSSNENKGNPTVDEPLRQSVGELLPQVDIDDGDIALRMGQLLFGGLQVADRPRRSRLAISAPSRCRWPENTRPRRRAPGSHDRLSRDSIHDSTPSPPTRCGRLKGP